jgi:beta-galactosidase
VPSSENDITFQIEGEGALIGVDNGDPQSHEDYKATHRKAFDGLCLAIVQSTQNAGRIKISASSPGLGSQSVTISTGA